jgi:hypothetical protein
MRMYLNGERCGKLTKNGQKYFDEFVNDFWKKPGNIYNFPFFFFVLQNYLALFYFFLESQLAPLPPLPPPSSLSSSSSYHHHHHHHHLIHLHLHVILHHDLYDRGDIHHIRINFCNVNSN